METKQELSLTLNGKEYLLDIEQAKQLGLLKEKNNRVKNWEEFREKYRGVKGYWFDKIKGEVTLSCGTRATCEQLTPHEAKAISAFSKLIKLRRDWIGDWEPDWTSSNYKYVLYRAGYTIRICNCINTASSLAFPSNEMAKEFLETFHDLIEEAKMLI